MLYSTTRNHLESVVQWLEGANENTAEEDWTTKSFELRECILDFTRMAQSQGPVQKYKDAASTVRNMYMQMAMTTRKSAVVYGKKALAELPVN
jgi:hypothetical protein